MSVKLRARNRPGEAPEGPPIELGAVLQASDFTYLGCFSTVAHGHGLDSSRGTMTGRRVAGQLRLIMSANESASYDVYEMLPSPVLHATVAAAVAAGIDDAGNRMSVLNYWGRGVQGANLTAQNHAIQTDGGTYMVPQIGIHYLDGLLYWNCYDNYNTLTVNNRVFGAGSLDTPDPDTPAGVAGACTAYGPWRTSGGDKKQGAFFFSLPQDVADAYFDGRRLGFASTNISGANANQFGFGFWTLDVTDITAVPQSERTDNTDIAFDPIGFRYDIDTRQDLTSIGPVRQICGWDDPGFHSTLTATAHPTDTSIAVADTALYAGTLTAGESYYTGYLTSGGSNDAGAQQFRYTGRSTTSGAGNLTGIPAFGEGSIYNTYLSGTNVLLWNYDNARGGIIHDALTTWGPVDETTPDNVAQIYDFPGNLAFIKTTSGKHGMVWFASLCSTLDESFGYSYPPDGIDHVWYGAGPNCPHGQTGASTTGPKTHTLVPYVMIYDIRDIAAVSAGDMDLTDLDPIYSFSTADLTTQMPIPVDFAGANGMYWDEVAQRLYVCVNRQDITTVNSSFPLPVIHVFGVA